MPTDDIVKRLNNLLQMRTALESVNVSPQYLNNETARRDAIKLEKQGNQIDPVTKKPKKYSEKYLQSTGQQIPGLDSDGTSAMNALDLIGLPGAVKIVSTIGREGIKRGIGRVATNLIETKSQNISSSLKGIKFKDAINAIIKDKPLYEPLDDEVPYRMMFGLKPRKFTPIHQQVSNKLGGVFDDVYAKNPDGSLRFKPESASYKNIQDKLDDYYLDINDEAKYANPIEPTVDANDFVMGHFKLDPKTGRYWDKWDVDLNPGELKYNIKRVKDLKSVDDIYSLNGDAIEAYNTIPTLRPIDVIGKTGEINKTKLALEKTKSILRLLERAAVRKTVNAFTDPVILQGTVKPQMRVF